MRASTSFIGIDGKSALKELFPAFEDEKVGKVYVFKKKLVFLRCICDKSHPQRRAKPAQAGINPGSKSG